ncbi:TPA: hypothetical protein UMF52_003259 [Stenotrophomonas maltophilia]|nr:hypothetical protein [Stenotrophomonas maltophilia]
MNKKIIGAASLVVVASIIGGVVYRSGQADTRLAGDDAPAREATHSGTQPDVMALESTRSLPGKVRERGPLDGVERFGQLLDRLKSSSIAPAQRAQYLLTAAQVCEGAREGRLGKRTDEASRTYAQYTKTFCSDFSGSSNEFALELLKYPDSDVVIARELASSVPLERDTTIAAQDIVLKSQNPDAVYNAAAALASGTWAFGVEVAQNPQERSMLREAQWLASQRLACDLSGGCGAGGMTSMIECASYGICTPGMTVSEVFARTQPEARLDLADRLYARLLEVRSELVAKSAG